MLDNGSILLNRMLFIKNSHPLCCFNALIIRHVWEACIGKFLWVYINRFTKLLWNIAWEIDIGWTRLLTGVERGRDERIGGIKQTYKEELMRTRVYGIQARSPGKSRDLNNGSGDKTAPAIYQPTMGFLSIPPPPPSFVSSFLPLIRHVSSWFRISFPGYRTRGVYMVHSEKEEEEEEEAEGKQRGIAINEKPCVESFYSPCVFVETRSSIGRFALNVFLEKYLRNKFEGSRIWSLFLFIERDWRENGRLALAKILGTRGNKRWF